MSARDRLHRLVDELPESELSAAARFLHDRRATADPVLRALLEAPPDDEPETEGERHIVQEAQKELARGEVRALAEVRCELDRCAGPLSSPPAPNQPFPCPSA
jgi:hypothetical protein